MKAITLLNLKEKQFASEHDYQTAKVALVQLGYKNFLSTKIAEIFKSVTGFDCVISADEIELDFSDTLNRITAIDARIIFQNCGNSALLHSHEHPVTYLRILDGRVLFRIKDKVAANDDFVIFDHEDEVFFSRAFYPHGPFVGVEAWLTQFFDQYRDELSKELSNLWTDVAKEESRKRDNDAICYLGPTKITVIAGDFVVQHDTHSESKRKQQLELFAKRHVNGIIAALDHLIPTDYATGFEVVSSTKVRDHIVFRRYGKPIGAAKDGLNEAIATLRRIGAISSDFDVEVAVDDTPKRVPCVDVKISNFREGWYHL